MILFNIGEIYGHEVIPSQVDEDLAVRCAAQLYRTHACVASLTLERGQTIGQSMQDIPDPGDITPGPLINARKQTVIPGQWIGLWKPNKPADLS